MTEAPLTGKITNIIDEYIVIINIGAEKGVAEGMKFEILGPTIVINDPDSGEELGKLELIKARVRVTEVKPKYSIAESYEQIMERSLPFPSFTVGSVVTERLPVNIPDIEFRKEVKVGDIVRQIFEGLKK